MGLIEKAWSIGGKLLLKQEKKLIGQMLKNGKFIYLDNDRVKYTNREGVTKVLSLDKMALVFIDAVGGIEKIAQVGLTIDSFKKVLVEARKEK